MVSHITLIDGLGFEAAGRAAAAAPTLLKFLQPDFVARFLADLQQADWLARLEDRRVLAGSDGVLLLDQPVHRAFYLAVVDVRCLAAGFPRVDPARIGSAGLVLRREGRGTVDGWQRDAAGPLGWTPLPGEALAGDSDFDPDAERRRRRLNGKNAALLAKLDRLPGDLGGLSEETVPLFKIPAEIAATIGRTLLYGYVPLSAGQTRTREPAPPPFGLEDVAARVPALLRSDRTAALIEAGLALPPVAGDISRAEARQPNEATARGRGILALMATLTWLAQETGAFTDESYADGLVAELGAQAAAGTGQVSFYHWLRAANDILVQGSIPGSDRIRSPDLWPELDETRFERLVQAANSAMVARWGRLAPAAARFPAGAQRYHLRCFARLEDRSGCPPRAIWSPPSTGFRVRPWYESGDAPATQIELPPLNRDSLRALQPNVAFKVPAEIQQFMDRMNLQDLMDGKSNRNRVGFGMICGFSIPIITICAFIVLQIFLVLFHILFWWLPFIRICIPYPTVSREGDEE